jgi:hypothetical protein
MGGDPPLLFGGEAVGAEAALVFFQRQKRSGKALVFF